MLQIVALPVAEMDSAPSPKYSTIAPVPPFTVRMPATLRITSFDAAQPDSDPCRCTPMSCGRVLNGQPAMTSTASAPPTPIATIPRPPALGVWLSVPIIIPPGNAYCSSTTWWMIPEPGFQKPMPYFADTVRRNSYTSEFTSSALPEVDVGADARLDEVVAVHGGRHLHRGQAGGHELEQRHLRGGVLHGHAVGSVVGIVDGPFDADGGGVVGVGEQHLLGKGQGTAEPATGIGQRPRELGVDRLDELDGRGGPDALRHDVHLFRCSDVQLAGYAARVSTGLVEVTALTRSRAPRPCTP